MEFLKTIVFVSITLFFIGPATAQTKSVAPDAKMNQFIDGLIKK